MNLEAKSACLRFTITEILDVQSQDSDLNIIRNWLTSSTVPSEGELFLSSPAAKSFWLNKEQFVLLDGVLYR